MRRLLVCNMLKCLFVVCSLTLYRLPASECLYAGDRCHTATGGVGTCRLLAKCEPLMAEIQQAGSPMPHRLGQKLRSLACGYESDEPVVCCSNAVRQDTEVTSKQAETASRGPRVNSDTGSPSNITEHKNLHLLPKQCGVSHTSRIIGGTTTRLYEMPWMVLLSYELNRDGTVKSSCGGTLIHERYVLTAAHCITYLGKAWTLSSVVLGEHDVNQDPDCQRVWGKLQCAPKVMHSKIESVTSHPGYSPTNLTDDIALLRLAEPANFSKDSYMKPICLPDTLELQAESLEGKYGTVAGWGATESGLRSPVLLSVDLPIVSNTECLDAYKGFPEIIDRQLCAGGVKGKDSCAGDSGGPLAYYGRIRSGRIRYVQRGVVSFGSKICATGRPAVYTRVASYMDWILDNMSN